jgi:molecular chaperone GrpE
MADEKKDLNLEELKKELEKCQKEKADFLAGWQRARADFLNYKKEEIERIEEILKYANEELILKFLPILDNFYLVEKKIPENLKKEENVKGILQLKNQFLDFLKKQGVQELKTIGKKFDPNFHEATEMVEAKNVESGIILEETQKGYLLHGKVLRPAKVKVAK